MTLKNGNRPALGAYLKSLRQRGGLTLRAIEKMIGISSAFLSQLESGKVKQPSPLMLYKLASAYNVSYEDLMERAGYPVSQSIQKPSLSEGISHRLGPLSNEEEESLMEYLSFLRSRSGRNQGEL